MPSKRETSIRKHLLLRHLLQVHIQRDHYRAQITHVQDRYQVIKACRDRIYWSNLTVFVLAEVRFHAMEDTHRAFAIVAACSSVSTLRPAASTTDEANAFIRNEVIEHPHRVGPTTSTSHNSCWQFAFCFKDLLTRFAADDGLEITNDHGEWMSAHNRAQYIVRIGHAVCPFAQCFQKQHLLTYWYHLLQDAP